MLFSVSICLTPQNMFVSFFWLKWEIYRCAARRCFYLLRMAVVGSHVLVSSSVIKIRCRTFMLLSVRLQNGLVRGGWFSLLLPQTGYISSRCRRLLFSYISGWRLRYRNRLLQIRMLKIRILLSLFEASAMRGHASKWELRIAMLLSACLQSEPISDRCLSILPPIRCMPSSLQYLVFPHWFTFLMFQLHQILTCKIYALFSPSVLKARARVRMFKTKTEERHAPLCLSLNTYLQGNVCLFCLKWHKYHCAASAQLFIYHHLRHLDSLLIMSTGSLLSKLLKSKACLSLALSPTMHMSEHGFVQPLFLELR